MIPCPSRDMVDRIRLSTGYSEATIRAVMIAKFRLPQSDSIDLAQRASELRDGPIGENEVVVVLDHCRDILRETMARARKLLA